MTRRTIIVGFGGVARGLAQDAKMAQWFPYAAHAQVLREFRLEHVMDRCQRRTESERSARKKNVLCAWVDRAVGGRRRADALVDRHRRGPISVSADEEQHWDFVEMLSQVHHRPKHACMFRIHASE